MKHQSCSATQLRGLHMWGHVLLGGCLLGVGLLTTAMQPLAGRPHSVPLVALFQSCCVFNHVGVTSSNLCDGPGCWEPPPPKHTCILACRL